MTSVSKHAVAVKKEIEANNSRYRILPSTFQGRRRKRKGEQPKSASLPKERKERAVDSDCEEVTNEGCQSPYETEQQLNYLVKYSHLLSQSGGVVRCTDDAAVIQDFDLSCSSLTNTYYVAEKRTIGGKSIFFCSCSPRRTKLAKAADSALNIGVFDEESKTSACMHCQVWQCMMPSCGEIKDIDMDRDTIHDHDHEYSKKPDDVQFFDIPANELLVCVYAESSFSIVEISNANGLQCQGCRKQQCPHIKALSSCSTGNSVVDNFKVYMNLKPKFRDRYVPECVSKEKINFEFQSQTSCKDQLSFKSEFSPSFGCCPCGNPWGNKVNGTRTVLFTLEATIPVTVYDRECTGCTKLKEFDGGSYGILNMGSYLIQHSIYRRYAKQFLTDGTTLSSFYKQLVWDHFEKGDLSFSDRFTGYRFRNGWYSFLALMDIPYEEGFMCPTCGPEPDMVIMDGVTLGIKKSNMVYPKPNTTEKPQLDGSSRVFIQNQQTRRLLKGYATKGITHAEFVEVQKLAALYCPCLLPLLLHLLEHGSSSKSPKLFAAFLCSLSSDYPLLSLIHSDSVCTILKKEGTGGNFRKSVSDMAIIEESCPSIFQLLTSFDETPDFLSVILSSVVDNVRQLLNAKPHDLEAADDDDLKDCRKCFPSLPPLYKRGSYILDNKNKDHLACKKGSNKHPSLTPGLFTMSCCHGICYGFSLMDNAESPDIPFSLLRTRFRKAPKVVIYDNACNLQQYSLNRDPGFFANTWFLIDRFHWPNHTACHEGFNLSVYEQHRSINSQVAEQRNSTFKKIKPMLSYMSLQNFIFHCKFYVWFRNMISIVNNNPSINLKYSNIFKLLSKVYSK